MIGTKVRGFRHLVRMAKASNEIGFFFKHDFFHVGYGVALYVNGEEHRNQYMMSKADYIMIFNTCCSNVRFNLDYHKGTKYSERIEQLCMRLPSVWVLPIENNKSGYNDASHMFTHKIFVPEDFEKKYAEFCDANKKQIPNATKYADIDSSIMKYFFAISNGSKNFFFWAVNSYFKQGASIYLIEKILLWNDRYSQLSKKLKKGTITGYTSNGDFFYLIREMTKLRRDKRANDVINMFNTAQKKLLKGTSLSDRDYETLSKFGRLSGKKKNNFIRKMSTIEDASEILKQMSFLADVHFEWKKESLLDFIKNTDNFNCEIAIDRDNIVLLKVKDYETVKRLAKTTNWCISKDKKYWDEYVERNPMATQYVLFDFSRKEDDNLSIVGFTSVHDRGITNAHDFQNKNLMQCRRTNGVSEIKSFIAKFVDCSSIYGVLDKYGIKLSDVVTYEPNQYKWDRKSVFDYLNQCVDYDDYYIIYDDGKKVALIAENDNIRYFLGDTYIDQRGARGIFGNQHIIFMDFEKNSNDPEKLVFGVITHNYEDHESSCARLFNDRFEPINQSFDSKLEEFNLPYDTICRNDDIVERFYNSLSLLELATLKDLIKDKKVIESIKNNERSCFIRDCITDVTFGYNSADYINLFYDNGLPLSSVIGTKQVGEIGRRLVNNLFDTARHNWPQISVPSSEDIESLLKNRITNYNKAFYTGSFLLLMKLIDSEPNCDSFNRIVSTMFEKHCPCDLFDLVFTRIYDKVNIKANFDIAKFTTAYAYQNKRYRVINAMKSKKEDNKALNDLMSSFKPFEIKSTELWVKNENGEYIVEGVNEEAAAHAPRRR